jgi:ferric iron reductase protein FhuF
LTKQEHQEERNKLKDLFVSFFSKWVFQTLIMPYFVGISTSMRKDDKQNKSALTNTKG